MVPVEKYPARSLGEVKAVLAQIERVRVFESGGTEEGRPPMIWAGWE